MNPLSVESMYAEGNEREKDEGVSQREERTSHEQDEGDHEKIIPQGRSFIDILVYNNDPEDAVESLKEVYSQLKDQSSSWLASNSLALL